MWRRRELEPGELSARVEAFLTACALHAGQRESDLINVIEQFGKSMKDAASSR